MPANVESMMYYGKRPWHGLGVELNEPATAEEAIIHAGMDWEVQKHTLAMQIENDFITVPHYYVTVRQANANNPSIIPLGVVKERYTPLQNKDAFTFFDSIVEENAAIYHTAGVLGRGERIWILAKLPGEIRVIGNDITEKFLLLTNSHDGTSGVQAKFTPIRVVCQNTLNAALSEGDYINIRHTPNVMERIKNAKELMKITNTYYDNISEIFQQMAHKQISSQEFSKYIQNFVPEHSQDKVIDLFESGNGTDMKEIRGTVWNAFNAVTEFVDHHRPRIKQENRLKSIWFGSGAMLKQKSFNLACEYLKAA